MKACLLPQLSSMESACTILYFLLWLFCLYHVFLYHLIKEKIVGEENYVFWFSL
jgi:hypothetical protein